MASSTLVLGVNGSPRPFGRTRLALEIALEAAKLEGVEVSLINLSELKVLPCIGCVSEDVLKCKYPCVLDDDMKRLYDLVLKSHGMVLATPVYWFNVSGLMKNFIDRLTALENMVHVAGRSWLEGKAVGFVAVGDDTGALAAIQSMMVALVGMGAAVPPWAFAYHESPRDFTRERSKVLDLMNVGRAVALMAKASSEGAELPKEWYRCDEEYEKLAEELVESVKERLKREAQRALARTPAL